MLKILGQILIAVVRWLLFCDSFCTLARDTPRKPRQNKIAMPPDNGCMRQGTSRFARGRTFLEF
jgi:hypothetical protein